MTAFFVARQANANRDLLVRLKPVDQPTAVLALDVVWLFGAVEFIADFADQFLDQVLDRDQTHDLPVLVDHEGNLCALLAKMKQHVVAVQAFNDEQRRPRDSPEVDVRAAGECAYEVFHVEDADDMINRPLIQRQAGESTRLEHVHHLGQRLIDADGGELGARRHNRADGPVGKSKDALDDARLLTLHDAAFGALAHQIRDVLLGHGVIVGDALAQHAHDSGDRQRQDADDWPRERGEHGHHRRGDDGEALGVLDRQTLRDKLAQHQ